ncbi:MAG: 16S rRNA (cytidine(1402)-2'-O)-methyltransferase [Chloroflexota bacterium]
MPGTLFVVATPIGNLEDLTLRAARILCEAPVVAAEDTRHTRKLLSHLDAHPRLLSYNQHNAASRTPELLAALAEGQDVALVSDAGVPAVSDPGAALVAVAAAAGVRTVPVPGPSALTALLSIAGFSADSFHFLGFLPRQGRAREALLARYGADPLPLVCFEAPHRLRAALEALAGALGPERAVCVGRELTKLHEEFYRGTLAGALGHFSAPRGEFALAVEGAPPAAPEPVSEGALDALLARLKAQGLSRRDGASEAARALGVPKREAYARWPV